MTGPRDLAEGDLVAVAKVTISNAGTREQQITNRAILWTFAICIASLAMLAAYLIVRYVIVKPLKHLRDVSDAVSRGNLQQRAEIRTADEFEELAVAFNRMLGNLIAAQEELRRLNSHLDLKVDELAQANMRLFELNRLKSDFLATMSHELRTPLNSIIGFSDVLSSIKSLDDKQLRYVQNIQKSGKMLLDMINDILDLAKIESGKMELRPSEFRIEYVIGALCDMARPLAERKNLDLDIDVASDLPELFQDLGKVQQILNNLLSNAIKFTPDGGRIVISARTDPGDELLLTVSDTGVGISDEDQAHIFEKFRQGRTVMPGGDAMTREYSGSGLGLSIVKELCKLLGGDVSVESELGKGSTFTVRLPCDVPAHSPADASAEQLDGAGRASRDDFAATSLEV
jgi:signal transduction histidine kinase